MSTSRRSGQLFSAHCWARSPSDKKSGNGTIHVISARPFDEIVAAIKASIGNPNMAEFVKSTQEAKSATDLEVAIQPVLGRTGLMLFVEFDQGMILRKDTDRHGSRIIRLVVGNPLIMKETAKHVPDAGS